MITTDTELEMSHKPEHLYLSKELRPFTHQVAGQSLFLHYNETTICKGLTQREYQFYKVLPESLRPFVPEFRGVIQIYVPDIECHDSQIGCSCSRLHHRRPSNHGVHLGWRENRCASSEETYENVCIDPIRIRALKKVARKAGGGINDHIIYFMLLEDLMSRYRKPCVLDLKMGVRQHGDDAPPEKVAYQVNKCRSTTSASLGLRLCGMKRYNVVSGEFEVKDKMYGRQLNDEDVKTQIKQFLFNGEDFRLELVDSIILQLNNLKNVIEQLDRYRFYSCSLLIIYEGQVKRLDTQAEMPAYLEDPSNPNSLLESQSDKVNNFQYGEDIKCPVNMKYKETVEKKLLDQTSKFSVEDQDSESCNGTSDSSSEYDSRNKHENHFSEYKEPFQESNNEKSVNQELADIRLVDFAHSTFDGFISDTVKHCGSDYGFLLGVSTLLEIFTELKDAS